MRAPPALALFATVAMCFCAPNAQAADLPARPGLWQTLMDAATSAGLGSELAPLILGNAYAIVQKNDADDVRLELTRQQLMFAYRAIDRRDLYQRVHENRDPHIDSAKFDASLKGYILTVRRLHQLYFDHWQKPQPDEKGPPLKALKEGATAFASLELALRRRIMPEDKAALSDTLGLRGLIYLRSQQYDLALADFPAALELVESLWDELDAIEGTNRAFAMRPSGDVASEAEAAAATGGSSNELSLVILIIQGAISAAAEAIEQGNQSSAERSLQIAVSAVFQGYRMDRLMNMNWPCHPNLAAMHYWRGWLGRTWLVFARKFPTKDKEVESYTDQALEDYRKAIEITLFSEGSSSKEFAPRTGDFVEFLRVVGRKEEAREAEAAVKSLGTTAIGVTGPEAWRRSLDCRSNSM